MNSLPKNIDRHTVFKGQSYNHTFVFPAGYTLPAPELIRMEIREGALLRNESLGTITVNGLRVTFTYTSEDLQSIPELCNQYLVLGPRYVLGGQLYSTWDYGDPSGGESQIVIEEGAETVVEITDLTLIQEQVNIATEKAEQTAADRVQTGIDVIQTGADVVQTGLDRQATEDAKNDTLTGLLSKANYKAVNLLSDLVFPMPEGIVIVKQDNSFGAVQVQFYYSDGVAASVDDLWMLPTSKRSTVVNP